MAIELRAIEDSADVTKLIRGCVAHLGRNIPAGKQGLSLQGRHLSDHHGKIIYAYDSYRYVNLTSRPTQVYRGPTFTFQLDPFMPECEVFVGDRLELGSVIVEIKRLVAPVRPSPPPPPHVSKKFLCRYLRCRGDKCPKAIEVIQTVSDLAYRLRDYAEPHQILRTAADWLVQTWTDKGGRGGRLHLGLPESMVITSRPGQPPTWPGADVPIPRGFAGKRAADARGALNCLPAESFDRGLAFRVEDRAGKGAGLGAGIWEEMSDADDDLRAGHFIFVQYPPARAPTDDDVCLLNHAATHVSELLGTIQAARIRRERELQRKGGVESSGLFHDMQSDIRAVRTCLTSATKGRRADAEDAVGALNRLERCVNLGLQALEAGQGFKYDWHDIHSLCKRVFDDVFDDSISLRQTRHWRVRVLGNGGTLPSIPCDEFGVERVLRNLVRNALNAAGKRGLHPLVKRVHLLLDCPRIDGLDYIRVRLADDGAGLGPEALGAIFEGRFTTTGGGHGLGAQVVAEQIRRHRGFLAVASQVSRGTVVSFLLPAPPRKAVDSLDDPSRWIRPYLTRAEGRHFIERYSLEAALAADKTLRAWFQQQGAMKCRI